MKGPYPLVSSPHLCHLCSSQVPDLHMFSSEDVVDKFYRVCRIFASSKHAKVSVKCSVHRINVGTVMVELLP